MSERLQPLLDQVQKALDKHYRSCLVCMSYKLVDHGSFVKCEVHQRVWEYADRLSPLHEEKCLRRARNCPVFNPEWSAKPWKRLNASPSE